MKRVLAVVMAALAVAAGNCLPATAATRGHTESRCSAAYFDGNPLLGPRALPAEGLIAFIVAGYRRLAGLGESQFLATYWDPAANGGRGGWRYPPDNGFLIVSGRPVEFHFTLVPGQQIDRFGSEYGGFLAPKGTSYARRSLPPQSLDGTDPAFTCNYHLYRVVRSFEVEAGPIAPGFGQPGLGLQYQLVGSLLPGDPPAASVMWLISHGYLQRLN